MDNIENKDIEKTSNDLLETLSNEIKELREENSVISTKLDNAIKNDVPERKNIVIGNDYDSLKNGFKDFLKAVPDMRLKSGVSVPIPPQYFPEIAPSPGRTDIKSKCRYQGNANSTVMYITKTVTAPTGYWMSLTGGGTSTTLSSAPTAINLDCFTVKIPIYDYQFVNSSFDPLKYMKDEVSIVLPKEEAKQILAGTGSPFTGIYGDSSVTFTGMTATGAITNLTLTDLRNCVASIYPEFRTDNLKWYVDMSEEQTMLGVCDANNRVTDVSTGVNRILGFEVVPLPSGILNASTVSTTASKHFILANLYEAVEYADLGGYKTEAIRTVAGCTDYYIYYWAAFGIRNPYGAGGLKLHA